MNYKETRPWGQFENLLDSDYCKVKEITIKSGQAPSYQYHYKRSEVYVGDTILVPVLVKHRVTNIGDEDLVFIEIQHGEYFGEDDIVRVQDSYGRV